MWLKYLLLRQWYCKINCDPVQESNLVDMFRKSILVASGVHLSFNEYKTYMLLHTQLEKLEELKYLYSFGNRNKKRYQIKNCFAYVKSL